MDRKFILTCGSTVDLPYDYCQQREIPVIFYTYVLDGVEREDDMERNPGMLEKFYQAMREGAIPQTSQINTERYIDFFTEAAQARRCAAYRFRLGHVGFGQQRYERRP